HRGRAARTAVRRAREAGSMSSRPGRRAVVALVVLVTAGALALPALKRIVSNLTLPLAYTAVIRQQAREKHLDPALIAAVIFAETKFDARTSATGALGLMQIEPGTAEFLAHRSGATGFAITDLDAPDIN